MTDAEPAIAVRDLAKDYVMGSQTVHALAGVSFAIEVGEYVAVMGPSGSGKSTLMNLLGGLDRPTRGSYRCGGRETSGLSDADLATFRNEAVGFVFQQFNLLARLTALENVAMPLVYADVAPGERATRAQEALAAVGLEDRMDHRPTQLSGGQQQRVAIARALANRPTILLADEPTGALDTRTGVEILALFERLHAEGLTVLVVTHDEDVAAHAGRVLRFRDGKLERDEVNARPADAAARLAALGEAAA